jgi:hypothetical protein
VKRIFSPDGRRKRTVSVDNIKSNKFSSAGLEALITAKTISGHGMYIGEAERPGTLVFILTLNGPALSKDLAQRAVIIELAKPQYSGTWESEVQAFINKNRSAIIADLIGILRGPQRMPAGFSRWGVWERDVLSRLPDPTEAQLVIAERQQATDADSEEADAIEDHFQIRLTKLGYAASRDAVFIPSQIACQWFAEATGERGVTTPAISRRLRQAISEGTLRRLRENACGSWGRGFVWMGEEYNHNPGDPTTFVKIDLIQQITFHKSIQNPE